MKQDHDLTHKRDKATGKKSAPKAQDAMSDYFEDMFGGMQNDPLKELKQEKSVSASDGADKPPSVSVPQSKKSKPVSETKVDFAEREVKPVLQQVVIPAAFPKMPPQTDTQETESVREKLSRKVAPENKIAPEKLVEAKSIKPSENKAEVVESAPKKESVSTEGSSRAQTETSDTPISNKVTESVSEAEIDPVEINEPAPWLQNGRPAWGQERFECLLFTVAGLKLAVPLASLGSIYKIEHEFTPLVGRAEWFMGLYLSQDRNVQVVDTAKWVMPDRYHDQIKENYQFIIRLGGNNWGIACDQVHEAISLEPSQVRWRSERSKRPWLSGTVIDQMCALLDADTLSYLLQKDIKLH